LIDQILKMDDKNRFKKKNITETWILHY